MNCRLAILISDVNVRRRHDFLDLILVAAMDGSMKRRHIINRTIKASITLTPSLGSYKIKNFNAANNRKQNFISCESNGEVHYLKSGTFFPLPYNPGLAELELSHPLISLTLSAHPLVY